MRERGKWQGLLAAGTIGFILALNFQFGSSTVEWIGSTASIVLATWAFVYGPVDQAGSERIIAKCRRLLRSSPQLEVATIVVWTALIGVCSYAAVDMWRNSQLLTIGGRVEESSGALAPNASVSLKIGSYSESMVASDGHFLF